MQTLPADSSGAEGQALERILLGFDVTRGQIDEARAIQAGPAVEGAAGSAGRRGLRGRPLVEILLESGVLDAARAEKVGAALRGTLALRAIAATEVRPPSAPGRVPATVIAGSAPPAAPVKLAAGMRFGRYVLGAPLGAGGMGVVLRATDPDLKREVALKLLLAGEGASEEMVLRFHREAQAAAKLTHPGIVPTYDVGVAEGKHYFTMELVRGGGLDGLLKRSGGRLAPREAMRIALAVADALDYAHAQGIVHRDLKPENILLDESAAGQEPRPRLTDFGLARIADTPGEARLTRDGWIMGTPAHMAPEQAEGLPVDSRCDIYSLGSVLYETVTGRLPYAGGSAMQVVVQKLAVDPPTPRSVHAAIAPDVETIITKAMERRPDARYATMRDLADDLRRCLAGEAIAARPIRGRERAWRWVKARPALAGLGALAAVALAALALAVAGPARLSVVTDPPGAEVRIDGRVRGRTPLSDLWIWPPGEVMVEVSLAGRLPGRSEVRAVAMRREEVSIALSSDTGALSVSVQPENAEWVLEQGGKPVVTLSGSLQRRPLHVGTYVARVRAPGYHEVATAFEILPAQELTLLPIALEHERALLSIDSSMAGASVWVHPLIASDEPDARLRPVWKHELPEDPRGLRLPLPLEGYPLDTGRYRLVFAKDGCLPRECRIVLASGPPTTRRNASLTRQVRWARALGASVWSSPALADLDGDGTLDVAVGAQDGRIRALSGEDGTTLWEFDAGAGVESSPGVADLDGDGVVDVVVGSDDGRVYALEGRRGRCLWAFPTGGRVKSSPALADLDGDGRCDVVVGSWDKRVYALSGRTGARRWVFETRGGVIGAAAFIDLNGDRVPDPVIGSLDGRLYAISGADGAALWSAPAGESVAGRPAVGDLDGDGEPEVVVGSWDGSVYAFAAHTGGRRWRAETGAAVNSSAALADLDGKPGLEVVIGSDDGVLRALAGADGAELWAFETGAAVISTPALRDLDGDGVADAVFGSEDGRLHAVAGRDGLELWGFQVGDRVNSSPALADLDGDGTLDAVVGGMNGMTYALNAEPGRMAWSFEAGGAVTAPIAAADVDGDRVPDAVVGAGDGVLRALSGRDGGVLWQVRTRGRITGGASVIGGRVFVGSWDGSVYALNAADGTVAWTFETGGPVASTPEPGDLDGDGALDLVVGSDDRRVYALRSANGAPMWTRETEGVVSSSPRIVDLDGDGAPEVVVGSGDQKVYALAGRDGAVRWSVTLGGVVTAAPALGDVDGDGRADVILGAHDGRVCALRGRDGSVVWERAVGAPVWSTAALADLDGDGVPEAVVGTSAGRVIALGGKDGAERWAFQAGGAVEAAPAFADLTGDGVGDVVAGSADGRVYALDGRSGAPLWRFTIEAPVEGPPTLVDLDGDRLPEVLIGGTDARVYALHARGGHRSGSAAETAARVARCLHHGVFAATLVAERPTAEAFAAPVRRLQALAGFALGRAEAADDLPAGAEGDLLRALAHVRAGRPTEAGVALKQALVVDALAVGETLHRLRSWFAPADLDGLAEAGAGAAAGHLSDTARGMAWLLAHDPLRADEAISRALASTESSPAWYFYRGLARRDLGRAEAALADFERCRGVPEVDARARDAARAIRAGK